MAFQFQEPAYTVGESASPLQVCVEMIDGETAVSVEVNLMTGPPGNAEGVYFTVLTSVLYLIYSANTYRQHRFHLPL